MPSFQVITKVNPRANKVVRAWSFMLVRRVISTIAKEMRRVVNVPYPPASQPGEAPHKRTGTLQASIQEVYDERTQSGSVSVGAPYASYLEKGTKKMKARPFGLVTARRVLGWLRFAGTSITSVRSVNEE